MFQTRAQNGKDKTAIPDYGKSSMVSNVDSSSSSGGGVGAGGNKNDAGKSAARFGG